MDISHNNLEDVTSDKYVFLLPSTLTELYMSDNKLSDLPWHKFGKPNHMDILDLANNNFSVFDQQLVQMLNNKTDILFEGKVRA